MNILWELWVLALVLLAGVFYYCEKHAAMRGSHREPLPAWQDKLLRFCFFWWLMSPMCVIFGWNFVVVCMLYLPSYLDGSEKLGTRDDKYLRSARIWSLFKHRMNLKLVCDVKLNPHQQYIIGIHPHSILPWGGCVNMVTDQNNAQEILAGLDIRFLAASFAFCVPLYRDLLLYCGGIDAARFNAVRTLKEGKSLMLVPGGATEALYAFPGVNTLVLRKRRGFIRLALESGAHLVPVYSFNENDAYNQWSGEIFDVVRRKFQSILGISLPLVTNFLPRKCHVTTVIGNSIPVQKVEEPTEEQVSALLEQYIAGVEQVFRDNAEKYNCPNNLIIL